jgi:hypothetical protein
VPGIADKSKATEEVAQMYRRQAKSGAGGKEHRASVADRRENGGNAGKRRKRRCTVVIQKCKLTLSKTAGGICNVGLSRDAHSAGAGDVGGVEERNWREMLVGRLTFPGELLVVVEMKSRRCSAGELTWCWK